MVGCEVAPRRLDFHFEALRWHRLRICVHKRSYSGASMCVTGVGCVAVGVAIMCGSCAGRQEIGAAFALRKTSVGCGYLLLVLTLRWRCFQSTAL